MNGRRLAVYLQKVAVAHDGERVLARFDAGHSPRVAARAASAEPEDVVGPVLFLLGPGSAFMTGQVLHVNGGLWQP